MDLSHLIKMSKMNHFLSSFPIVSLSFSMNVALKGYIKTSVIFLTKTRFTSILDEGLKLWCAEQSVGCVDVLGQCVHCVQWTRVSHRATAAETTGVCLTDFMSLPKIVVQGDVQVSADTNSETCKSTSEKTFSVSHRDIGTPAC